MLIAFRIADGRFPVFDGTGALMYGGRWNSPGRPVIYAAETFAGAMLEVLIHANLNHVPRRQVSVRIEIPEPLIEIADAAVVPAWQHSNLIESRAFGDRWLRESRSAALFVPGMATSGHERNVLINPRHPEFGQIIAGPPEPVGWDRRLFARSK